MSMLADGNPFIWIEIPALDLERAKSFYAAILDVELQEFDAGELRFAFFPMQEGAANGTGALVHHPTMYRPSHDGALVYFAVRDIEAVLARVERAGGRVFQHRKPVGAFGFVGFFEDSEGNRIGLHAKQ
ncbi:MAG TPA: VOC family protein [Longimicrobiales bacterium]